MTIADYSTFVYSVNRDDIIRLAMTDVGALGVGEDIAPEDLSYCADKLNMLVKQWQGTSDFAPGLKMWSRKRADLFLEVGQIAYELGDSDDKWVPDGGLGTTTLSVAAAAAAATVTLTSASAVVAGTKIGILLTSGSSHWTSAASKVGNVVTLLAVMPSAAAIGATVYYYTNNATRPLQLLSVSRRNRNNQETQLTPLNLEEYESLPAKVDTATIGTPCAYYYEAQLTAGVLYLDRYPDSAATYPLLHIVYLSPIEDLVMATDTPDYPQNWYRALAAQLAMDIAPGFQLPASKELMALRNDAVSIARNHDPDTTRAYFQPYAEEY